MSQVQSASVLLVCMGNICRSPTAEGVLRKQLALGGIDRWVTVDSAGTHAYHIGDPPDTRAIAAARQRGIDLTELRARVFVADDFQRFDYILAMDTDNLDVLLRVRPENSRARVQLFMDYSVLMAGAPVPDPYYGGPDGFERVLDMLEEASEGFIAALTADRKGQ